jgi:hypothetical protein
MSLFLRVVGITLLIHIITLLILNHRPLFFSLTLLHVNFYPLFVMVSVPLTTPTVHESRKCSIHGQAALTTLNEAGKMECFLCRHWSEGPFSLNLAKENHPLFHHDSSTVVIDIPWWENEPNPAPDDEVHRLNVELEAIWTRKAVTTSKFEWEVQGECALCRCFTLYDDEEEGEECVLSMIIERDNAEWMKEEEQALDEDEDESEDEEVGVEVEEMPPASSELDKSWVAP